MPVAICRPAVQWAGVWVGVWVGVMLPQRRAVSGPRRLMRCWRSSAWVGSKRSFMVEALGPAVAAGFLTFLHGAGEACFMKIRFGCCDCRSSTARPRRAQIEVAGDGMSGAPDECSVRVC